MSDIIPGVGSLICDPQADATTLIVACINYVSPKYRTFHGKLSYKNFSPYEIGVSDSPVFMAVTDTCIPHQLIKDDVYDGIFLPAGTNFHTNQW